MTGDAWLGTVRIARDLGGIGSLLPPGVDSLDDCPFPLFDAIQRGLIILSWDELPRDERPARRIWGDDEALIAHFERVERERDQKYGLNGSGGVDDPVENAAARSLIAG